MERYGVGIAGGRWTGMGRDKVSLGTCGVVIQVVEGQVSGRDSGRWMDRYWVGMKDGRSGWAVDRKYKIEIGGSKWAGMG